MKQIQWPTWWEQEFLSISSSTRRQLPTTPVATVSIQLNCKLMWNRLRLPINCQGWNQLLRNITDCWSIIHVFGHNPSIVIFPMSSTRSLCCSCSRNSMDRLWACSHRSITLSFNLKLDTTQVSFTLFWGRMRKQCYLSPGPFWPIAVRSLSPRAITKNLFFFSREVNSMPFSIKFKSLETDSRIMRAWNSWKKLFRALFLFWKWIFKRELKH